MGINQALFLGRWHLRKLSVSDQESANYAPQAEFGKPFVQIKCYTTLLIFFLCYLSQHAEYCLPSFAVDYKTLVLQGENWVVAAETLWPTNPVIFHIDCSHPNFTDATLAAKWYCYTLIYQASQKQSLLFSIQPVPFYIPNNTIQDFYFSISSPMLIYFFLIVAILASVKRYLIVFLNFHFFDE